MSKLNFDNNNNSKYKIFGLTQVTIFWVIISIFIIIIASESLKLLITVFFLLSSFSLYNAQFINFILKTALRFKIFIALILLISYLNNFTTENLLFDFFKIYDILILSIIFNSIINIDHLMNLLDYKLNSENPNWVTINLRKLSYSFLLGVKFIPELFNFGRNIQEVRKIRGFKVKSGFFNKIKSYANILIPIFIYSFIKAKNLERSLTIRGFSFERKRTLYRSIEFKRIDYLTFLTSILLIILVLL